MTDRQVHAAIPGVMEVVRYDRAGKWYVEPLTPGLRRWAVTVGEAAEYASTANTAGSWEHYEGLLGGRQFDRRMKKPW